MKIRVEFASDIQAREQVEAEREVALYLANLKLIAADIVMQNRTLLIEASDATAQADGLADLRDFDQGAVAPNILDHAVEHACVLGAKVLDVFQHAEGLAEEASRITTESNWLGQQPDFFVLYF